MVASSQFWFELSDPRGRTSGSSKGISNGKTRHWTLQSCAGSQSANLTENQEGPTTHAMSLADSKLGDEQASPQDSSSSEAGGRARMQDAVPHAVGADLEPGTMVGEYQIEWIFREGGMGTVYAATHPVIKKKAAIKVISANLCADPCCVERFIQEARAVNEIGHPNIVDIFSFGRLPDGRCYFVMEWLPGQSLADRMLRHSLSLGETYAILEQICDALEAAHETGIVHRDLKPDNVF